MNELIVGLLGIKGFQDVMTPAIRETMLLVDRGFFCPTNPYFDSTQQLPVGKMTISAPHMHAIVLSLLENKLSGARCLVVGTGSGYGTVLVSKLAGPSGSVASIDHIEQLTNLAKSNNQNLFDNLKKQHGPEMLKLFAPIDYAVGDGRDGWPGADASFDIIQVQAMPELVPRPILNQLKKGGRMVIPLKKKYMDEGVLWILDKDTEGVLSWKQMMDVVFVPLTSKEKQLEEQWRETAKN